MGEVKRCPMCASPLNEKGECMMWYSEQDLRGEPWLATIMAKLREVAHWKPPSPESDPKEE